MYGGLASLKLPTCYDHDGDTKNIDCPVCDPNLGLLAKEVPFSHHVNSTIVCRLTGKIMDENNSPLAFPVNGHVYSKEVRSIGRSRLKKLTSIAGPGGYGCSERRHGNLPENEGGLSL